MMKAISLALIWRPYVSPVLIALLAVLLIVFAVRAFVRSGRALSPAGVITLLMRVTLIACIAVLLMGPSAMRAGQASTRKPTLRILLDASASMQTPDVEDQTRYDYARLQWLSPDRLTKLRNDYDVRLYTFDKSLRAIDESRLDLTAARAATAGVSNIADSVADGLSSRLTPGSAMLVLSDGRDTFDAPMHPVGEFARAAFTPIYTVPLGGPSMARDLAVIAVPAQPYLFADEPGSITVRVIRSNILQRNTVLHVRQGDQLDTYPLDFKQSDTASLDIPVRHETPGTYDYTIWTDPVPGEADEANNTQPVFIQVTAKRLRVLILEGQPYWDTKFLAHALRKDPRIDLTQITQLTEDRRETIVSDDDGPTDPPDSLDALAEYDVVILGRGIDHVLDEQTIAQLPAYVADRGGRLVFARGRAYDPLTIDGSHTASVLSALEPVVFGEGTLHNQRLELEPAGLRYPGLAPPEDANPDPLLSDAASLPMPTLLDAPVIEREKSAARVLARTRPADGPVGSGPGQAAIATMPYGRGMVVAVLGDGLWRWALHPRRNGTGDERFDRFWMDSVRWLALGSDYRPGEDMSLRLSRLGAQVGEPIRIDLFDRSAQHGASPEAEVESPQGQRTTLPLKPVPGSTTRYQAEYRPAVPGVHHVRILPKGQGGQTVDARFNAYRIDVERMHTSANPAALRTLAQASGGRCLNPLDPDALDPQLTRQRLAAQTPPTPHYLWDRGWVLTCLLCLAGLEWIVRKAGGLP